MAEGDDEPGFLPPQAPGAQPPPRFAENAPPEPAPEPAPPPAQPPPSYGGFEPPTGAKPRPQPAAPAAAVPPSAHPRAEPAVIAPRDPSKPHDEGNSPAIASFSLAILGFVMFFVSGFGLVFILNLPCSIAAWALAPQGVRRVEQGRTRQHLGLAKAGRVMGIIGTIVGVVAIVTWGLLIALDADVRHDVSDMFDNNDNSEPDNNSLHFDAIQLVRLVRVVAGLVRLVT